MIPSLFFSELEVEDVTKDQLEGIRYRVKDYGAEFEVLCADLEVRLTQKPRMTPVPKVLSDESNSAVVHLPDRQFPGLVVQGDTMTAWHSLSEETIASMQSGDLANALEAIKYLEEAIRERLLHYERVLRGRGLPLPYAK